MIALVYEHPPAYLNLGFTPAQIAHLKGAPADDITAALIKLGHTVIRIPDIGTLTTKLAAGEGSQWDLAVNVTEGVHGSAREAQVPAMLEAFGVPYTFSDSATMALCLDKGKTKVRHSSFPLYESSVAIWKPRRGRKGEQWNQISRSLCNAC